MLAEVRLIVSIALLRQQHSCSHTRHISEHNFCRSIWQRYVGAAVSGFASVSNGVDVQGGGVHVAGGALLQGGVRASAGFVSVGTLHLDGAQASFSQSTIAGGLQASGSMDILHGGLAVSGTGAYLSGGLHVSEIGVNVVDGGFHVEQTGAMVSGGARVASGGVLVRGVADMAGAARIRGGARFTNTTTIGSGGVHVLAGAGMTVANGLRAIDAGLEVTGRFSVFSGEALVHGGLDAKTNGIWVATGGVSVRNGEVSVAGYGNASFLLDIVAGSKASAGMRDVSGTTGVIIADTGEMRVSGGAAVHGGIRIVGELTALNGTEISSGGMKVAGRFLVQSGFDIVGNTSSASGATANGGISTSGLPLVVDGGATIVGSRTSKVFGGLTVSDSGIDIQSGGATMSGGAVAHAPITVSASDLSGAGLPFAFWGAGLIVCFTFSNCCLLRGCVLSGTQRPQLKVRQRSPSIPAHFATMPCLIFVLVALADATYFHGGASVVSFDCSVVCGWKWL